MNGRLYHDSNRRLKAIAGDLPGPEEVGKIVTPAIEAWRPLATPNKKDADVPNDEHFRLTPNAVSDLVARIRAIGMNLNRQGLKGIHFHNGFQRHMIALAPQFDCRGWTESKALFDDPESAAADAPTQLTGRVDVIWARERIPVAVFEIDSTVKARSFQKLKEAAAAHKFWVYFGRDVWGFKTFLLQNDPMKEITPVLIPQTFVPSFETQQ